MREEMIDILEKVESMATEKPSYKWNKKDWEKYRVLINELKVLMVELEKQNGI
jgi:hypothetical protein